MTHHSALQQGAGTPSGPKKGCFIAIWRRMKWHVFLSSKGRVWCFSLVIDNSVQGHPAVREPGKERTTECPQNTTGSCPVRFFQA